MREIILDTETTGLDPRDHRITEIGCVELFNHLPTGVTFQRYINPERDVSPDAERISGLNRRFLSKFPCFSEVAQEFLEFIGDTTLVIHNADFDIRFLNAELNRLKLPLLEGTRVVDTLKMARQAFPGASSSLDALCRRYGIDIAHRTKHGALLDSELLAQVYLELRGGRQMGLSWNSASVQIETTEIEVDVTYYPPRPHQATAQEHQDHQKLIAQLRNPLWEVG